MPPQDTTALDTHLLPLADAGGGQNLLDIIAYAGGFQWPIFFVFVLGLGALMNTMVRLFNDGRESTELRQWDIAKMLTDDFRRWDKKGGQSVYYSILSRLLRRLDFTSDHGALLKTVAAVIQRQNDRLAMTNKLVAYCSSAAGGLGLAGTLVGMYSLFAASGTDPAAVYVGIALALVSTLLGVAASLILEAAETFVSRVAGKQSAAAQDWGEDLCARMSYLMKSKNKIAAKKARRSRTNTRPRTTKARQSAPKKTS